MDFSINENDKIVIKNNKDVTTTLTIDFSTMTGEITVVTEDATYQSSFTLEQ